MTVKADCDDPENLRKNAMALYRAIFTEAKQIAKTKPERESLSGIQFMVERLEVGYYKALDNARTRLFNGFR